MAKVADKLNAGNMLMVVVIAIIAVYLWGTFTNPRTDFCTQADVKNEKFSCKANADKNNDGILDATNIKREGTQFVAPEQPQLETSTLWIIKLLIIGGAVWLGYGIVSKFIGRNMNRRDILSVILLGVAVYFIWVYFIEPSNLLQATRFACDVGEQNCRGLTLEEIGKFTAMKLGLA